jgi:hypothetical protein
MSSGDLEYSSDDGDETGLVAAVFARDAEEAQHYCELLADHGIVGIVDDDDVQAEGAEVDEDFGQGVGEGVGMTRGVAVLVEEALLDEAGVVIADREDLGEFKFDEDDEIQDDDDELDFAQGIDSEFQDDTESGDAGAGGVLSPDPGDLSGLSDLGDLGDLSDLGGMVGMDDLDGLGRLGTDLGEDDDTEDIDFDEEFGGKFDED